MVRMLYFAYGSNLNLRHMKRTAPHAKPLCTATLPGYRFVFRGFADITPDAKASTPGALYELTPACVRALDAYEGDGFRKLDVTVQTEDGARTAMAYVMIDPGPPAPPSMEYYQVVARGY